MTNPHTLELQSVHASGAQEWHCQHCARRILVTWEPKFKRIILEAGDEFARHDAVNFETVKPETTVFDEFLDKLE